MSNIDVHVLEAIFLGLLVIVSITIVWFAALVVYRLFKGQR